MFCYFCETQIHQENTLCFICFEKAFKVATQYYQTNDIETMIESASLGDEGDAMTFKYENAEKACMKDMSGGKFYVSNYEIITDFCKYDHDLWRKFFPGWVDLSTSKHSEFWSQCFNQ